MGIRSIEMTSRKEHQAREMPGICKKKQQDKGAAGLAVSRVPQDLGQFTQLDLHSTILRSRQKEVAKIVPYALPRYNEGR